MCQGLQPTDLKKANKERFINSRHTLEVLFRRNKDIKQKQWSFMSSLLRRPSRFYKLLNSDSSL